jgi:hypothetical protein
MIVGLGKEGGILKLRKMEGPSGSHIQNVDLRRLGGQGRRGATHTSRAALADSGRPGHRSCAVCGRTLH